MRLKFIVLPVILLTLTSSAHAMRLSLVGAADSTKINDSATSGMSGTTSVSGSEVSKLGFGGGALLGWGVAPFIEFETGALLLNKKWQQTVNATVSGVTASTTTAYTGRVVEIPAVFRLHLLRFLSIGAGGFADIGTGHVTADSTGSTTSSVSETWAAAGKKNRELGALFSAALHMHVAPLTSFLIDGRYLMGLSDINGAADQVSPANKETFRTWEVLAGIQFHFGLLH